jgi:hypothetical protein
MHFRDLNTRLPSILDSGISVELVSAPGRGKSEFVRDFVAERPGWGMATMFLATMTPSDLMGYLHFAERGGRKVSEFSEPAWLTTVEGKSVFEHERGVLFLDEFGQGEADTKRASAELLLNRQLGPHRLPDGWSVIAASNRANDRSGVTKSFDFVINRRIEINITDDLESWEQWAVKREIAPEFITFAVQNPHIVFADGVPAQQGPWCTPRSLVMTANLLGKMRDGQGRLPVDANAVELSSGLIGQGAAAQLFATIRLGLEMPPIESIIADPEGVKVPEKPDARMLVSYNLAARVDKSNAEPVIKYVERMPKEFAVTFAKSAIGRDRALITAPAFVQWASRNSSLITQIQGLK